VGDDPAAVAQNRRLLRERLDLPAEPHWLRQVHGCEVAAPGAGARDLGCEADAAVALGPGVVCAVLTADCLPVLLCDRGGTRVAAVHAGWRGLAEGVIEAAVTRLDTPPDRLIAWLGPAIGRDAFEVGGEVRERFLATSGPRAADAFRAAPGGKWLADLYLLAGLRLAAAGVKDAFGGGLCTFSDPARFFSYRRDGVTGRMASLIWLSPLP
jgi:YfiH family protein